MEGDEEKEKTFRKRQKKKTPSFAQVGRTTRFMGGDQTKEGGRLQEAARDSDQERHFSGAGGEDFVHF